MRRKPKAFFYLVALIVGLSMTQAYAMKIEGRAISQQQVQQFKEYYDSGNYFKEIDKKLIDAKDYLDRQLQYPRNHRLAIVFDVDETALSNYRDLERLGFTRNIMALSGAAMLANAQAVPGVLALHQHAVAHGVAVFFISSRPNTPEFIDATIKNLKKVGYDQWVELILKPIDRDDISVTEFKTNTRRRIALQDYDIVLNIGDQDADLQGGYAEAKVKIPNPFYEIS